MFFDTDRIMTQLTRRRDNNPHQKGWDVYYGDVRIGHIGTRAGVPKDVEQWGWSLGFYPGTDVGDGERGIGYAGRPSSWRGTG